MSDTEERFALIELDLPKPAPGVAPVPAPAPTPAPTALEVGRAQLLAANTVPTVRAAANEIARGPIGKLHPQDPLRVTLRQIALARMVTVWWVCWLKLWADIGSDIKATLAGSARMTGNRTREPLPVPTDSATLEGALTEIASQGASNAAVQGAGSMRGGQLAGVGFTSADGYVTALRNGVKQATADSYKNTLRTRYSYSDTQIAALTVTIIPEAPELPSGPGIVHGPASSDAGIAMLRARRTAHGRQVARELHDTVRATLGQGTLIAGLITERALLQWGWVGGGETTRGRVIEALTAIGCERLAPPAPSAVRYAGDAVDSMRSREYDTKRLTSADLPDGVKARWLIGRAMTGESVMAGASYGTALLVVSLHDDQTLTFDGDPVLAAAVRSRYDRSTAHETLRSDVLTAWLGRVLKAEFYAIKRGSAWYVPAAMRQAALMLCEAIAPLWGDHETISVTNESDVTRVIANGLTAEIVKLETDVAEKIADAQDSARKKAAKDGTDPDLAARRAILTVDTAAMLVKQVALVATRFSGYSGVFNDDHMAASLRARLTEVQRKLAHVGGDASIQRAAMLELD